MGLLCKSSAAASPPPADDDDKKEEGGAERGAKEGEEGRNLGLRAAEEVISSSELSMSKMVACTLRMLLRVRRVGRVRRVPR